MNKPKPDSIITFWSGHEVRFNKDGTPDKRYKYAKHYKEFDKPKEFSPTRVGKAIPKKPKLTLTDKIFKWLGIAVLAICLFGEVANFGSKTFDATLYRTAHATEKSSLELNVGGKKAYLENPRTIDEIKDYIRFKFKDNYQIACMVAYSESLRGNGINSSPVEYSVGIFQINLADNYGQGRRIHWNKVPGDTLEEKTAWLQTPKNNVDLAFEMSRGGTDWNQWAGYTSGWYSIHLEECL